MGAGVGNQSLMQAIFLIQGSNPGLLHCRQILYHLSHQGSPRCGCATVSPAEGGSRAWYPQVRGGCDGRAVKGARPSAPQEGPEGGESDRWRPRARSSGARWIRGPRHSSEAGLALAWLSVRGPGPSFGLPPALAGPPLRSPPRARRVCYCAGARGKGALRGEVRPPKRTRQPLIAACAPPAWPGEQSRVLSPN